MLVGQRFVLYKLIVVGEITFKIPHFLHRERNDHLTNQIRQYVH